MMEDRRRVTQAYVESLISAIVDGYRVVVVTGDYPLLSVENPHFKEDDGSDPYIVVGIRDIVDESEAK